MGGLRKKKWTGSKANQYVSRGKACKKLQVSLPVFRRLCILKGIYPHDPKKKHRKEGDKRVYYHVKDIKYLRREPYVSLTYCTYTVVYVHYDSFTHTMLSRNSAFVYWCCGLCVCVCCVTNTAFCGNIETAIRL